MLAAVGIPSAFNDQLLHDTGVGTKFELPNKNNDPSEKWLTEEILLKIW